MSPLIGNTRVHWAAMRETRVARWLFHDRGPEREAILHHRRIFVLPTRGGLAFVVTLLALLIASMNYQLSLGYLLTFLIGAAAWAGLHMTFANLAGLRLAAVRAEPVFAGETIAFEIELADTRGRPRYAVRLRDELHEAVLHVGKRAARRATTSCASTKRGWQTAPRITIDTVYPLGLWRAWSYWQPDARCLVYPAPEAAAPALPQDPTYGRDDGAGGHGQDAVAALRPYSAGDAPRLIAWKAYARSGGERLASKQLEGSATGELWLDIAQTPASLGREGRIARLTAWVLAAHAAGLDYGLRIDNEVVELARGDAHRNTCLARLALARP
ncbi:MAG TPA: DUF58 domain-containing protein [Burkholderiaceae bacterium]|nr:DUF58 domain-containing protein [Burkholderiaceae bacterium]